MDSGQKVGLYSTIGRSDGDGDAGEEEKTTADEMAVQMLMQYQEKRRKQRLTLDSKFSLLI